MQHELAAGSRTTVVPVSGVAVLMPLLQPHTDTKLLLSAIDCLWNTVVPSESNVGRFVERDGVLQLMDCLEVTPFAPRAQLLSCLADMLTDPRAAEQCQEWHGKKRQCSVQLLLRLWSEEEARLGGATGGAMLTSTARPLTMARDEELARLNDTLQMEDEEDEEEEARPTAPARPHASVANSNAARVNFQTPTRRRLAARLAFVPLPQAVDALFEQFAASEGEEAAAIAGGLPLTTLAELSINGRFEGLGAPATAHLQSHQPLSSHPTHHLPPTPPTSLCIPPTTHLLSHPPLTSHLTHISSLIPPPTTHLPSHPPLTSHPTHHSPLIPPTTRLPPHHPPLTSYPMRTPLACSLRPPLLHASCGPGQMSLPSQPQLQLKPNQQPPIAATRPPVATATLPPLPPLFTILFHDIGLMTSQARARPPHCSKSSIFVPKSILALLASILSLLFH